MINTRSSTSYSTAHKLHPLSLLAQLISRQVSGCLRLSAQSGMQSGMPGTSGTRSAEWRLLLDKGQLNFATSSVDSFDRLIRQVQAVGSGVPVSVCDQMRLLFENSDRSDDVVSHDYRALCWLVEQKYLSYEQAAQLIGAIAIEVIEPFLSIREGSYELISRMQTEGIPTYCRLDLRPIVEICQRNGKQRAAGQAVTSRLPASMTGGGLATATGADTSAASTAQAEQQSGASTGNISPVQASNGKANLDHLRKTTYTVACIDDSPTVLNAIQKFLEDQSLSVVAINDPVKALMQIVRSKPDLILLDITMPNLDGYELCALLRRHPRYKRTPIVMVTGNTGLIDRARAKLVRASGYLTKPFTQSDLLKIVFKHLPTKR